MVGGYTMVDCTGLDLTKGQTPQTINGIYNRTITAMTTNKPIVAYNCNWNSIIVTPIQVFAIDFGAYIVVTSSTLQVIINNNDTVTINNMGR